MVVYKKRVRKRFVACCICIFLIEMISIQEVFASEEGGRFRNSFIILGPAATPEYMGSDDYGLVPMLVSAFEIKDVEFEIEGLTVQAALADWNSLKVGLTADVDPGRDSEVDNTMVAAMEEIDIALNLGAFVAYELPSQLLVGDNFEFKLSGYGDATSVHKGAFATLGAVYTLPLYIPWRFEFELETTFANGSYMDTYFGVDEADARASGLPVFKAGSSVRDISLTTNIAFFLSPQWGLFSRLSVGRLLGDAADSPVTSTGSATQYFAGIGLLYRF